MERISLRSLLYLAMAVSGFVAALGLAAGAGANG